MKKSLFLLILLFILLFIKTISYSQNIKSEFAAIAGVVSMQSDYGERGHFGSSYANIGFGVGGTLYLSAETERSRWNDKGSDLLSHIRLRLELSYMKVKLIHRGSYTQNTSPNTVLYNAMQGTSNIMNYGGQIEYSIYSIESKQYFDPYLSIGFLANSNSPKLESSLGNIQTNTGLIPNVYTNGVFLDKNTSTSLVLGVGARIRTKNYRNKSIYLVDFRWQRFNSDIVEGLSPKISANKFNDWLLFVNVGYIFNLN